jgi:hypothetical protein
MSNMPEMPEMDDPAIEALTTGAKILRQLFVSYTLAGFTDEQALDLVKHTMGVMIANTAR